MSTDLILSINLCFEDIYPSAHEDAHYEAPVFLKDLQLEKWPIEQQVLKLQEVKSLEKRDMKNMEGSEYVHEISCEAVTYQLFSARMLFNKSNDESIIRRGFTLKERVRLLEEVIGNTIAQCPPSTYASFLTSDMPAALHDLKEKPDIHSLTQYLLIKNWQTEKMMECVKLESSGFIDRFIASAGASGDNTVGITAEIQQVSDLFKNASQLNASQFVKEIAKLKAFDPKRQPEDKIKFHEAFCAYLAGEYHQSAFNASFLQSNLEKIRNNKLSDAPLCCWSLITYKNRLEKSLESKADLIHDRTTSYEYLFVSAFLSELYHRKEQLSFKKKHDSKSMPSDEYKKMLLAEMEKYRLQYNLLKHPEYYHLLLAAPDITRYKLKQDSYEHADFDKFILATAHLRNYFINNCFHSIDCDIHQHTGELEQVIQIHKMMVFLMKELSLIDEDYYDAKSEQITLDRRNIELIASMVPTKKILSELMDAADASYTQALARVPIYIVSENLKESLKDTYCEAESHLEKFFKTQTIENKQLYITERDKELKYLLQHTKPEEELLRDHIDKFQKFLKIEKKGIKARIAYQPYEKNQRHPEDEPAHGYLDAHTIAHTNGKDVKSDYSLMAFNYNEPRADQMPMMYKALKTMKAIPVEVTLPQLRKLFNGQEVISPVKWLGSQGDLKVFIKEITSHKTLEFPYQQQWHIAVKCFVKADGSAFNAMSLKSAMPGSLSRKFEQAGKCLKG